MLELAATEVSFEAAAFTTLGAIAMQGFRLASPQVGERGQFAVRGGILDVYPWQSGLPVRAEFFDREIESLRRDYDALWERTGEVLKQLAELVVM